MFFEFLNYDGLECQASKAVICNQCYVFSFRIQSFYQVNILFNIVFVKDAVYGLAMLEFINIKSFGFPNVYRGDGVGKQEGVTANHSADQRNFPEFGRVYREIRCPGFLPQYYDCGWLILFAVFRKNSSHPAFPAISLWQAFAVHVFNNDLLLATKFVVGISKGGDTLRCIPGIRIVRADN